MRAHARSGEIGLVRKLSRDGIAALVGRNIGRRPARGGVGLGHHPPVPRLDMDIKIALIVPDRDLTGVGRLSGQKRGLRDITARLRPRRVSHQADCGQNHHNRKKSGSTPTLLAVRFHLQILPSWKVLL